MTIELTNAIFEDKIFTSTLTKVNSSPMGAKDAYWVNRIVKKIQEYGKEYIETKDKLIQQFKSEIQPDDITEGQVQIDPNKQDELVKEMNELFEIELSIPYDKRPFPDNLELSPAEIGAVEMLFDMSSLED